MYLSSFLHIYQPPTQKELWVRRITDESYRKVFKGLREIERGRLTLNINGILCELLEKYGGHDVIQSIRELVDRGQIELTGSAKYHAFLPKLSEAEIERQIYLNEATLNKYFGANWKKGGFFSPEMAYSFNIAKVAKRMGYKWMIVDELAFPKGHAFSPNRIYQIEGLDDFGVFFRERGVSFKILSAQIGAVNTLVRFLGDRVHKNEYAVTAMDGETFGHHRPGLEMLLFELCKEPSITPATLGDLYQFFKDREKVAVRDSTWASTAKDLDKGLSYVRWDNKENKIQAWQWELTDLAVKIVEKSKKQEGEEYEKARHLLDEALHSDQYWWASARPWWSLEMIERGAFELRRVIESAPSSTTKDKKHAFELYSNIMFEGFEWQRSGYVDQISRQEDEERIERLDEKEKMFVTREEYEEMIKTLKHQMKIAADAEEYHRASMIKDRIRELQEEMEEQTAKQETKGIVL
ncbi:MAG: hypothetical protein A3A04_01745 [Candidatus Harrisonbacteria bacterium RIFCSPLOWO2_01_FULL_40_28]|uniref:UVR domain-containing protein n=1 Tax=Candidatus Harrisonbacteria bacterium RIFCSPLOWO2_01_FULL_40_28 TaxID=1798406 RepID=A0A1G1ZMY8_9BACT|nr:MAG: hypothetical protein A3A04_01745 [Candidatus Harrisonbacteria bacterium RIFCSPLOWO2_01_FULL_40_28]